MQATYETELRCRRLDENGDVMFGAGDAGFVYGLEAMVQVLKTRIASIAGEWWEGDDESTIPWMTEIVGEMLPAGRDEEISLMIVDRITDTVGVLDVEDVECEVVDRHLRFSCTANTVYGEVPVEVET